MEIVLTEKEIENLPYISKGEIINNCDFCIEINKFLRYIIPIEINKENCRCNGCNENINVAFYVEKELSKKEYFRRFIEEPFDKNICDSYVKILNCGVIFIDETSPNKEIKYFIKQAINPEVMFEGSFKDFKFNEQLDKTLDLTETVEKDGTYMLKAYYRVYKTLENPKRFLI